MNNDACLRTICFVLTYGFVSLGAMTFCQSDVVPLWPEGIPNHQSAEELETAQRGDILWIEKVQEPTLEIFLPTKKNATGRAVVICPGGGYSGLAYDWEGTDVAKWWNSKGVAAFVLKYRLPKNKSVVIGHKAPLQDAQRAMRIVRQNAEEWNLSEEKIGVMGFSAGGHLASTLGTHYDVVDAELSSVLDSVSARPDFMVLVYPVITFRSPHTHSGSKNNLVGKDAEQAMIDHYSNELHVDDDTPPTFIVHSSDDEAVPVENSLLMYESLLKVGVQTEMHLYPIGGHGFGMAIGKGRLQSWTNRLSDWMDSLE